jgi:DNA-binding NarL/FixJ family response regulator
MSALTAQKDIVDSPSPALEQRGPISLAAARRSKGLITVLFLDPRPLTRECLSRWLQASARNLRILPLADPAELAGDGSVASGEAADLILFNIAGSEVAEPRVARAIEAFRLKLPDVPLVVLADREDTDADAVAEAICRGARGYIPTTLHASLVIEALRLVAAGGTFVPTDALVNFMERRRAATAGRGAGRRGPDDRLALGGFTARESEVLALLRQGKSNKIIAHELAMRESTAKVHVRRIMKKLNATNRTQAAFLASRLFAG